MKKGMGWRLGKTTVDKERVRRKINGQSARIVEGDVGGRLGRDSGAALCQGI